MAARRIVTLTGPGGVGKTRLALDAARKSHGTFRHGVWLAALAELTQPDLLTSVLSSALGTSVPAGTKTRELQALIGDRQLLILLDNCEHLTNACAELVTALLQSCPNLRLLATSREPLRIDGEGVFRVPPLSLPEHGRRLRSLGPADYDAVALFVDRAVAIDSGFSLTERGQQEVLSLCQRLDGLPLAIELAAAATRHFPIDKLSEGVEHRFSLPPSGSRTAPPRHKTLRATMDYSHDLCSASAQTLWSCMSVFRGGAHLDAIEFVASAQGPEGDQLWEALAELVDKSILTFAHGRYRLLETIRDYGWERLLESGSHRTVQRAHRDYFAHLVDELDADWFGPDEPALLQRVLNDQPNLRAALEYCLTERGESRVGMRMAGGLWTFWIAYSPAEGRRWLDRLLAADGQDSPERVTALWVDGFLTAADGDTPASLALLDQCQSLAERFGDPAGLAHCTRARGLAELLAGETESAIAHLDEAVQRERVLEDFEAHLAHTLVDLGAALCYGDNVDRALEVLEEARTLCLASGEQLLYSWSLVYLGLVAFLEDRRSEAKALIRDGLTRKRAIDDRLGINFAIEMLAWIALADGDAKTATRLLGASEATSELLGPHLAGFARLLTWHAQYVQEAQDALGARAFEAAMHGGRQLALPQAIEYALGEGAEQPEEAGKPLADLRLTPREREIALLVATGKTNKEIAAMLVIAHRTVDTHVENILTKLGFTSRTQIATLVAARDIPHG